MIWMSRFGGYADVLGDFIEGYPSGDWGPGGVLKMVDPCGPQYHPNIGHFQWGNLWFCVIRISETPKFIQMSHTLW
jgi:hypothetical protein